MTTNKKDEVFQPDFTRTSRQLLIDLINFTNRDSLIRKIKENEIEITPPYRNNELKGFNTVVGITHLEGHHIPMTQEDIHYNRIYINQFRELTYAPSTLIISNESDIKRKVDLLPYINEALKINLTEDDIVDEPLTLDFSSQIKEIFMSERRVTSAADRAEHLSRIVYPETMIKINEEKSYVWLGEVSFTLKPKDLYIRQGVTKRQLFPSFMPHKRYNLS